MKATYSGSCHCGAVRFEVDADLAEGTGKCNCSICSKTRNWEIFVKPGDLRILEGESELTEYRFGSETMQHPFCRHCGIRPFGRGNLEFLGGDFVFVNVAVLNNVDDETLAGLGVRYANGRDNDWTNPPAVTAHL